QRRRLRRRLLPAEDRRDRSARAGAVSPSSMVAPVGPQVPPAGAASAPRKRDAAPAGPSHGLRGRPAPVGENRSPCPRTPVHLVPGPNTPHAGVELILAGLVPPTGPRSADDGDDEAEEGDGERGG